MKNNLAVQYAATYTEIYNDNLAAGLPAEKAQCNAHGRMELATEVIDYVLETTEDDHWYCNVRHEIPVKLLKGFWSLTEGGRAAAVHELGMDQELPWRVKEGTHKALDGRPTEGLYVEGSERQDDAWLDGGYASWEAGLERQEIRHGKAHRRDLEQMARGKI